jgi:DNA-binding GntR family transcriptional regulator
MAAALPRLRLRELEGVSLAEQVREAIREAILEGRFLGDERLGIEHVAAELGVSRTPVREALRALEGDGLVRLLPNRGAVVEEFAADEIYHRYEIRAMVEAYAAELACRWNARQIARELDANCVLVAELLSGLVPDDDRQTGQLIELNIQFHGIIQEGAACKTFGRVLAVVENPAAYRRTYWTDPVRSQASLEAHRQITDAFAHGEPHLARKLMEQHLLDARDRLFAGKRLKHPV